MKNKITKMSAKFVIGFDKETHVIYENGDLVYQDNEIIFVGQDYTGVYDFEKDYGLSIISPGFIDLDADIDSDHALFDIATLEGEKGFQMGSKFRTVNPFSDEDLKARQRLSILQLVKNGITTALPITGEIFDEWNFSLHESKIMASVAEEIGMRMYLGPSFKSRVQPNSEDDLERENRSIKEVYEFSDLYPLDHSRLINVLINPAQISVTTLKLLKEMCFFAKENNFPFRIHSCEAIREWMHTLSKYGKTTINLFYDEEMLYDKFIIPHAITVTNEELKILAKTKVTIVNTPLADTNFATALFSFSKYQHYGVNQGIGTDTQPTDMIRNLRMMWDLGRLCWRRKFFSTYSDENGGEQIPMLPDEPLYDKPKADEIFNCATVNAAKALGRTDIGRLTEGCKADIIVISLDRISIGPYHDPIKTLLNSCNGNHVTDSIINGRTIMSNRKILDFDEDKIVKDAQDTFDRFANLYCEFDKMNRSVDDLFPPTYKIIK